MSFQYCIFEGVNALKMKWQAYYLIKWKSIWKCQTLPASCNVNELHLIPFLQLIWCTVVLTCLWITRCQIHEVKDSMKHLIVCILTKGIALVSHRLCLITNPDIYQVTPSTQLNKCDSIVTVRVERVTGCYQLNECPVENVALPKRPVTSSH